MVPEALSKNSMRPVRSADPSQGAMLSHERLKDNLVKAGFTTIGDGPGPQMINVLPNGTPGQVFQGAMLRPPVGGNLVTNPDTALPGYSGNGPGGLYGAGFENESALQAAGGPSPLVEFTDDDGNPTVQMAPLYNLPSGPLPEDWDSNGSTKLNPYVPGTFQNSDVGTMGFSLAQANLIPLTAAHFQRRYLAGLSDVFAFLDDDFEDTFRYYWRMSVSDLETRIGQFILPRTILCHPRGTRILTHRGPVEVQDLHTGDMVLTHLGRWRSIEAVYRKPYVGSMYSVEVAGAPFAVKATADHKFLAIKTTPCVVTGAPCHAPCRNAISVASGRTKGRGCSAKWFTEYVEEFTPVSQLKVGDALVHPIDQSVLSAEEITAAFIAACGMEAVDASTTARDGTTGRITATHHYRRPLSPNECSFVLSPDYWRFVGYWLGDGTLGYGSNRGVVQFSFGPDEVDYVHDIQAIGQQSFHHRVGTPDLTKYGSRCLVAKVSLRRQHEFFSGMYYSGMRGHKTVYPWIEQLPVEFQRQLLCGYWRADGDEKRNKRGTVTSYRIVSVSLPLLQASQRMGWRLGLTSTLRRMRAAKPATICGRPVQQQETYELHFEPRFGQVVLDLPYEPRRECHRDQWIDGGKVYSLIRSIRQKDTVCTVYPFTVSEDHSFTGEHFTSANCDGIQRGYRPGVDFDLDTRELDFDAKQWFNWGFMQLAYTPIMQIISVNLVFPTGQEILNIPGSWLKPKPLSGQVQILPPQGALSQIMLGPGGQLVMLLGGMIDNLPAIIFVDYVVGMWPIPDILIHAISMQTAIHLFTLASDVVSKGQMGTEAEMEGVVSERRQYVNDSGKQAFEGRIQRYKKEIDRIILAWGNWAGGGPRLMSL